MFESGFDQAYGLRQMMRSPAMNELADVHIVRSRESFDDVVLCMHSDPQSIKSAYQMMKTLATQSDIAAFKVYLYEEHAPRANKVFNNFSYACSVYLGIKPVLQGILPFENDNISK